jgi:CDP-diacylglycerol--glycerol-3-phosphate 3-phosphatidyltransferase
MDRAVRPIGGALKRTGVTPDQLTTFGLLLAIPTALAIGAGYLGLGLGLLIGSTLPDVFDGAVAKASGRANARGAFFDSVCDRISDTLVLGGMAWYLLDRYHSQVALLPMAILGASFLVSYERAKAESLGFHAKGGIMERAERVVVLCAALAFSFVMVPLLWVMLGLTIFTVVQRFVTVWRQATAAGQGPQPARAPFTRRAGFARGEPPAVAARWRAWREANGWVPRSARYGNASLPSRAGARWQERRQARLARLSGESESAEAAPPRRRRYSSRRP